MPTRTAIVGSRTGLHARPAAIFVAAASAQPVPVTIGTDGKPPVPARSLLSVLSLGATCGTQVTLEATGDGADDALDTLAELVARDLDAEEPRTEEPRTEEPRTEEPRAGEPRAEEPRAEEPRAEEPGTESAARDG
ncbi:HPr family phosphocarrier protein [Natronosporangium hydrolyticum]|uniref:Phosphocarrier protein HPr n=1 Tax=Natronosporangium hydrolyticum TaxID=2811111 RepID=A0A895Y792_9ACTN|nr:HPr family phosphocarrier protein [Natronosporangium hydrolyticum]QSB13231.1 HPr family phosphocarrier protein [Natronosporangium hydrolyticum]